MKNLLMIACLAACLAACGGESDPTPSPADASAVADAGRADIGSADATASVDAAESFDASETADAALDGGADVASDAGVTDSGAIQVDAARRDRGVSPRDTGVSPRDTGVVARDTGVVRRDIGRPDAGRPDAGQAPDVACAAYNTIRNRCAGCHGRSGGFSLGNGSPAAIRAAVLAPSNQARGMDYVSPGDLADSYLWHKINGTHRQVGGRESRMPPGGALNATQLGQIQAWVLAGAPAARCP